MNQSCPHPGSVRAFATGTLAPAEVDSLSQHLDSCEACRARYEASLRQADPVVAGLRTGGPNEADPLVLRLAARLREIPFEQPAPPRPPEPAADVETSISAEQTLEFDPLYVWLGIPPEEQPPDHYRLLGVRQFESNPEVIDSAADRQMAHLRKFQEGDRGELAKQLLNEVAAARVCLLDAKKKSKYDEQLKQQSPADQAPPPSRIDLSAAPPRTLDEFRAIVVSLGLIAAKRLEDYLAKLAPHLRPSDAEALARQLVADRLLTKHQAAAIYQGKWQKLVLGEYTLLSHIGGGGMGDVYKALHRRMGVIRAIKVIKRELVNSPDAVGRFQREVLAAAQLSHPHIVMAHDAGEDQGRHYLVMEYVEGPDLGTLVKQRGPLPVPLAIDFIIQAARGLAYAHDKGTIHRDIKPANLLLSEDGMVKVSDLGLARLDPDKSAVDDDAHLTTSEGKILGTVDFMAPEQAEDTHTADHRADIYSLGCTLYRLVTGKSPYARGSTIQRMMAHRTAPIPKIRDTCPEVPQRIDQAFARLVAKQPEYRPQTMEEVIELLEGSLSPEEEAASTPHGESFPPMEMSEDSSAGVALVRTSGPTRLPQGRRRLQQQAQKLIRSPMGVPIAAAGIALLLAVIATGIWLAALVFRTPYGEFVVEIDGKVAPDVHVVAKADSGRIEIASEKNDWTLRLEKGEYHLEVRGGNDQFELNKDVAIINRDGKEIVRLTRKETLPAKDTTPPSYTGANYALAFDGRNSRVETPVRFDPARPFTLEAWIQAHRTEGHQLIVANIDGRGGASIETLADREEWTLAARFDQQFYHARSKDKIETGRWYHVAGVWDDNQWSLYVDGRHQVTIAGGRHEASRVPFSLGASSGLAPGGGGAGEWAYHFEGIVDEVRFSSAARYQQDFRPARRLQPDAKTLALYHCDEGSGDVLRDSSGNDQHGTLRGARWIRLDATGQSAARLQLANRVRDRDGVIDGMAMSRNGPLVATCGWDSWIKVRNFSDVSSPQLVFERGKFPLHGHRRPMAISPDGRYITAHGGQVVDEVTGDKSDVLDMFEVASGRLIRQFGPLPAQIGLAAFTPDGRYLLTSSHKLSWGPVVQWEVATGEKVHSFDLPKSNYARRIVFSPDSRHFTVHFEKVDQDAKGISFWELATGKVAHRLLHAGAVSIDFFPDGRHVATHSPLDGRLRIWDMATGTQVRSVPVAASGNLFILPDERTALVAANPQSGSILHLIDLATGRELDRVENDKHIAQDVAVTPDGRHAITCGGWHWDSRTRKQVDERDYHLYVWRLPESVWRDSPVTAAAPGPEELAPVGRLAGPAGPTRSVAVSADGRFAASVSGHPGELADNTLRFWNLQTGQQLWSHKLTAPLHAVAISLDGRLVASAGMGSETGIRLWEAETGREAGRLTGHTAETLDLAFSPDGAHLLSGGGADRFVRLWDVRRQTETGKLEGHTERVLDVEFLPDGDRAATTGFGGTIHIWNIESGELERRIETAHPDVESIAVAPSGDAIASAGIGGVVQLWDVATGEELQRWDKPSGLRTYTLAFTPDGRHVIRGTNQGTLSIWRRGSDRPVAEAENPGGVCWSLVLIPGGNQFLLGGGAQWKDGGFVDSGDYALRLWQLPEGVGRAYEPQAEPSASGRPLPAPEQHTAEEIVSEGALLLLNFEKETFYRRGDDTYVRDLSGNGNDARCIDKAGPADGGLAGGAIDCAEGKARLPAPLVAGLNEYTIAGWAKVSANTFAEQPWLPRFFAQYGDDEKAPFFIIELQKNRAIRINALNDGWRDWRSRPKLVPEEGWVFLAVTLTGGGKGRGQLRVVVDDTAYETTLQSVGEHYGFAQLGVRGIEALDEIAVFKRPLSERELSVLRAHARAGRPLPAPKSKNSAQSKGE